MALSKQMQALATALEQHDISEACRLLDTHPDLAHEHAKNEDGKFVTALFLAMQSVNLIVVDRVLRHGARMDLPIGAPPIRMSGETAMTYALSGKFQYHKDADRVLSCMVTHYADREELRRSQLAPTALALDNLQNKAASTWKNLTQSLHRGFRDNAGYIIPASVYASMMHVVMVGAYAPIVTTPANTAAIALTGVISAGAVATAAYVAKNQKILKELPLSARQNEAIAEFEKIASNTKLYESIVADNDHSEQKKQTGPHLS